MAGEPLGGGEGAAVYHAVTRALLLGRLLKAAEHLDGAAVHTAECLGDEQLDVVPFVCALARASA